MWCDVMWCYELWCDVMWCDVMWCAVMWCDVMCCDVMWCDAMWCHVMSCYLIWCDMLWCDMLWCDVRRYDAMWCDAMWCNALRCDALLNPNWVTRWKQTIIPFRYNYVYVSMNYNNNTVIQWWSDLAKVYAFVMPFDRCPIWRFDRTNSPKYVTVTSWFHRYIHFVTRPTRSRRGRTGNRTDSNKEKHYYSFRNLKVPTRTSRVIPICYKANWNTGAPITTRLPPFWNVRISRSRRWRRTSTTFRTRWWSRKRRRDIESFAL